MLQGVNLQYFIGHLHLHVRNGRRVPVDKGCHEPDAADDSCVAPMRDHEAIDRLLLDDEVHTLEYLTTTLQARLY